MKVFLFLISTLSFLLFLSPRKAYAQSPSTSKSITVLFHVDPNDDPTPKEPATLFFIFGDTSNKFNLDKCDCNLTISGSKRETYSKQLIAKGAGLYNAYVDYKFPSRDVYHITLIGKPKVPGAFQEFNVSWDFPVTEQPLSSSTVISSTISPYIYIVLAILLLILVGIAAYLCRKSNIKIPLHIVRPIIFAVLVTLAIVCIYSIKTSNSRKALEITQPPSPLTSAKKFNDFWRKEITTKGSKQAYDDFKIKYQNDKAYIQHLAAHLIGSLLYQANGLKAITICDSTYDYGCYHGLFIKAVFDKGLSVVPALDKACFSNSKIWSVVCQHGIGHGLIEYFGYNKDGLLKSLDECHKIKDDTSFAGCTEGAVMGYQFPLSENSIGDVIDTRPMPQNQYELCDSLSRDFDKKACYYSMPQWWMIANNYGYEYVGSLCYNVRDNEQRSTCFNGLASNYITRSKFNVAGTIRMCNTMPDRESTVTCLTGAYWTMSHLLPQEKNLASKLCQSLTPSEAHQCINYQD